MCEKRGTRAAGRPVHGWIDDDRGGESRRMPVDMPRVVRRASGSKSAWIGLFLMRWSGDLSDPGRLHASPDPARVEKGVTGWICGPAGGPVSGVQASLRPPARSSGRAGRCARTAAAAASGDGPCPLCRVSPEGAARPAGRPPGAAPAIDRRGRSMRGPRSIAGEGRPAWARSAVSGRARRRGLGLRCHKVGAPGAAGAPGRAGGSAGGAAAPRVGGLGPLAGGGGRR